MARILVVDDQPAVLTVLCHILKNHGHEPFAAPDGPEAIALASQVRPHLAILDVKLPHLDGFLVARRCRETCPGLPVIMLTAYPSVDDAFTAGQWGICAYLEKPFRAAGLLAAVERALLARRCPDVPERQLPRSEPIVLDPALFEQMVGSSVVMTEVFRLITRVSPLDETVLVLGETGTGKELVARAIHQRSSRCAGPFVAVNCSAVPDTLLESEFFGHERGAFTDAHQSVSGKFAQASRGTLFLDEVGELSTAGQAKLLRAIETREITPVGGTRSNLDELTSDSWRRPTRTWGPTFQVAGSGGTSTRV